MDSEGFIYGRCLLSFLVKLQFCDIEDMLFCYFQWIGDSLEPLTAFYFIFYFFVATSGVTQYFPRGLFSLVNNTSPSYLRQ